MTTRLLFPSHLQQTRLDDSPLLEELVDACWMIEDGDAAGHAWCAEKGYPGYTSYASLDDLPVRATAFSNLADRLKEQAWSFAETLHWDIDRPQLGLDSLWVNILGEGGHHSGHIHPGSIISGTVYIDVPEDAGDIRFEDPRLGLMMAAPAQKEAAPDNEQRFVYIAPKSGDILMWESWLRHEVMPGRTEAPRLSISFNFGLERD